MLHQSLRGWDPSKWMGQRGSEKVKGRGTYILHHREDHPEFRFLSRSHNDAHTMPTPHQRSHIADARPLSQTQPSLATLDGRSRLSCGFRLASEGGFIDFEAHGGNKTDIGRYTITNGKGYEVTRNEGVGEESDRM